MPSTYQDRDLYLLVDGGKSKTEAVIIDSSGFEIAKSLGPGLEIIGSVNGYECVINSLRATFDQLPEKGDLQALHLG